MALERCDTCGEDTSVGTVLYSARHIGRPGDGEPRVRCEECFARGRLAPGQRPPEDDPMSWQEKASLGMLVRQDR